MMRALWISTLTIFTAASQVVSVRQAPRLAMPSGIVDGNSPGFWTDDGNLSVYTSTGHPIGMLGPSLFELFVTSPPLVFPSTHYPLWIESVWKDDDGTLYAWYHHEARVCGDRLAMPEIGALVSTDGGLTYQDRGIVLSSGNPANCNAQNGFFASGHGDFSVVPDRNREYFYFFFTNYGGPAVNQGVSVARMAFEDRADPIGKVWKFSRGEWLEPGVGGAMTPIFAARVPWERSNADSYWGAAIHWNTSIEQYVMLLNRSCCESGWPQEGIYVSLSADLSDPFSWRPPSKILDAEEIGFAPGYYPQAWGTGPGETDSIAGANPRLFVKGISHWELVFDAQVEPPPDDDFDPCASRMLVSEPCEFTGKKKVPAK